MQDRPTAVELLRAAQEFCEKDLMPQLSGRVRFHARVLQNVLSILEREWEGEEDAVRAEWDRLRALLEIDTPPPGTARGTADQVRKWNEVLSTKIRAGAFDDRIDELVERLSATVDEKLRIANPRWAQDAP